MATNTIKIYTLSRKDAIDKVKKWAKEEGKKNVKILNAYPFQEDDKGYNVTYAYDD